MGKILKSKFDKNRTLELLLKTRNTINNAMGSLPTAKRYVFKKDIVATKAIELSLYDIMDKLKTLFERLQKN